MKRMLFFASVVLLSVCSRAQSVPVDSLGDVIFEKVDVEASFIGGDAGWRRFLEKNIRGDVPIDNGAPSGKYTVKFQFIVDKDGTISDFQALTHNGYGTEQEVLRVLKLSGKWQPALQYGRAVKAFRLQPVTFFVESESVDFRSAVPYQFYQDQDNKLTITVDKVKPEDLEVSIPAGVVLPNADHSYTIHPVSAGRIIITVRDKKKQKELGQASFEVVKPK